MILLICQEVGESVEDNLAKDKAYLAMRHLLRASSQKFDLLCKDISKFDIN